MKRKIIIVFVLIVSLLLLNDIIFLFVNKEVNYKKLRKDLTSIKKHNEITYAKQNSKDNNKYVGDGYYIIKKGGTIKTHYSIYIKKKLIWNYNKINAR